MQPKVMGDLVPCFRTKLSMICTKGRGRRHVEKQSHGGADDRGTEASGGGRKVEDVVGDVGVLEAHTLRLKQLRDEKARD